MRVAVVHDWLYVMGGAERVLAGIMRCFPQADVFCLFDFLSPEERSRLGIRKTTTSFLQRMPAMRSRHRLYLPLMPIAVEQFDLSGYDLIISSSYAVAKGVLTGPDQLHVSYVHSPMRYAWDLQHQYLRESKLQRGLKSVIARSLLHTMRLWDVRTAYGVNTYIANSHFIARRIAKTYGRSAQVVHPPVHVPAQPASPAKRREFLAVSRLVPYKNIHVIVEAFADLPDEQLIVVGDGPEMSRLRGLAGANVSFRGYVPDRELQQLEAEARALVFAGEEDFGIIMAETQGQGTPVIALGHGGAREIVITDGRRQTGVFFDSPTPSAVTGAIRHFIRHQAEFRPESCRDNAARFGQARFDREFSEVVHTALASFKAGLSLNAARHSVLEPILPMHRGNELGSDLAVVET